MDYLWLNLGQIFIRNMPFHFSLLKFKRKQCFIFSRFTFVVWRWSPVTEDTDKLDSIVQHSGTYFYFCYKVVLLLIHSTSVYGVLPMKWPPRRPQRALWPIPHHWSRKLPTLFHFHSTHSYPFSTNFLLLCYFRYQLSHTKLLLVLMYSLSSKRLWLPFQCLEYPLLLSSFFTVLSILRITLTHLLFSV